MLHQQTTTSVGQTTVLRRLPFTAHGLADDKTRSSAPLFPIRPNSFAAFTTSRAIGAAVVPPYPPCSTTTAKAMLLERSPSYGAKPANHECGMPSSSCAVPVLPATLIASPFIAHLAVPSRTTERIASEKRRKVWLQNRNRRAATFI